MNKLCIVCFHWRESKIPRVCDDCLSDFHPGLVSSYSFAVYHYRADLRDLITRAKISGDLPALSLLTDLFLNCESVKRFGQWADLIIPAPSSLWGRLRGKYDIAYELAAALARQMTKPHRSAPCSLYWRLKKRSQQHRKNDTNQFFPPPQTEGQRKILLIDDILTTGRTLHEVAAFYPNDAIQFLTLASASGIQGFGNPLR